MPELYDLYGMAHTSPYKKAKALFEMDFEKPETFTNISAYHKLKKYKEVAKEKYGDDYNPHQHPIDTEVVMISGGGRPHGSVSIGDGLLHHPLTLPEIKAH